MNAYPLEIFPQRMASPQALPPTSQSTLFNALTSNSKAEAANFPFCTIEPNIGMVAVPDPRLDALVKLSNSRNEAAAGWGVVFYIEYCRTGQCEAQCAVTRV